MTPLRAKKKYCLRFSYISLLTYYLNTLKVSWNNLEISFTLLPLWKWYLELNAPLLQEATFPHFAQ